MGSNSLQIVQDHTTLAVVVVDQEILNGTLEAASVFYVGGPLGNNIVAFSFGE